MLSPATIHDIKTKVNRNEEKISILQTINAILKERHEIESNFKILTIKYTKLQKEETERRDKYDQTRKQLLKELECKGADVCKEHSKIEHQIDHITWHLDGCSRHRPCLQRLPDNCTKKDSAMTTISCMSTDTNVTMNRPSHMANLRNTAERLIKNIVDLRKKIYIVQDKLEHEIKRKRDMEKKLSELRKDISRQKKLLTVRATPTLSMSSSLPPIRRSLAAK